ncbi:hypothetical protein EJ05DRAFT_451688 [Pseudovirgaria hyperparasitica]|uniref:Histidine kinase HHK15p n=1 Tax=Pseudovirgaria hyperparasitica TaxID=470096 RepID=A0A6A6W9R2_9PEZI|nr:uncharacterized protein EJ05DRAFT_451688 [Pseudovirgaria hyperparasitica]KAF2759413.1 hypothetical protein EJ05DRAFT_451688 [Pseudovirgaria hyperparasitica]
MLPAESNSLSIATSAQDAIKHDWTEDLPQTDHLNLFRDTDWSRNGLGPPASWDATLQLFTKFVFADSRAACLWWGPDAVAIYNEMFAPLCYAVHPTLMGSTYAECFPELWPLIRLMFEESRKTGVGQNVTPDAPLLVERHGWKEEAFFSGSFVPIGPSHQPLGFYNSVFEVTSEKLADRRTSMLNRLAAVPSQASGAVIAHILDTLATNPNDITMALLYELKDETEVTTLQLHGQIGLPEGHGLRVDCADLRSSQGLIPDLRHAGSEAIFIDHDDRFTSVSWKGWEVPSKKIAILPIATLDCAFGYLVVGMNPYRPFDETCRRFAQDLNHMVSSIVSAAMTYELAEYQRERLVSDLAFSDMKVRHLVEHATVGMCNVSVDGKMLWANDHYYNLAGRSAEQHVNNYSFYDAYLEEDISKVEEIWNELVAGNVHNNIELRLKRQYISPNGEELPATIQVLAFPYRDPGSGHVKSVMACTTDISRLKWAEAFHARSAAEAKEEKKQQEAFIDIVSHEMRNPLSAIVHCADAIVAVLDACKDTDVPIKHLESLVENAQSATIILQCAKHQKRILDDVLTLSKLDSILLSITPSSVEPSQMIHSVIDMFKMELESTNINYTVNADPSIIDLSLDSVYLDASRVTQILINLLTNAMKFVKCSKQPSVTIRYGACVSNPQDFFAENFFWADSQSCDNVTNDSEWGLGENVYLTFLVQDSGIGLNYNDISKIFGRFSQASLKTHVTYGGSGLGLYISKQLAEKQGGKIGVTSVPGQGSTFGFYVKGRRSEKQLLLPTAPKPITNGTKERLSRELRVLLVEDNLINQQVLSKQLRRSGFIVDVANHGLEALEVLEKSTFDVVLMDSEMPVMDGLTATRAIRKKEREGQGLLGEAATTRYRAGGRLPIFTVTANVRNEQITAALAAGSDAVVQKPFKVIDLIEKMKALATAG